MSEPLARHAAELAALYAFTDRMHRATTLEQVYASALDVIQDALRCERASILLADGEGVMRFVAWRGLSDGYRRAVEGHSPWRIGEPDPRPIGVDDVRRAGLGDELARVVEAEGIRALSFIPLVDNGRLIGKFMVYYEAPHAFDAAELALAHTIGRQLAYAVERGRADEQRQRAERALRDADRRKDEFLATLAHELRNPLAPIASALEVMKRAGGGGAVAAESREIAERQLRHLVRLVDDLLDVSRITRNRLELRRERVELADVVHDVVETCRTAIAAAGHTLEIELPQAPVVLDADPARLVQALGNLLTNAIRYTEPGGRITLAVEPGATECAIRVTDTGIGIPPTMLSRVFEMFTQVERESERVQGGLGIGLALVRGLVEMHGGSVSATSAGPGRGSTFTVCLPLAARAAAPVTTGVASLRAATGLRVLVADDNADGAESLARVLELDGHDVRVAHDGEHAVELARKFGAEAVLLDIGMPRLDGFAACRAIRAAAGTRPPLMIAVTGWGQDEDRRRTRDAGFDVHLVKPVDLVALAALLTEYGSGRPA